MNRNPVSPKVAAGAVTSAVVVIVMYLLGQIGFIAGWPTEVKAALLVIVTAAVTFVAGYLTRDPFRVRLEPGGEHRRDQTGAVQIDVSLIALAVTAALLLAAGIFTVIEFLAHGT